MKTTIKVEKTVNIKTLEVQVNIRYWEDAYVDGVEDIDGDLIPCKNGAMWCPIIDVDSGVILNWGKGKTATIHYKVCDEGYYSLKDEDGNVIFVKDGYVPNTMCPEKLGYSDYIIMKIDENGKIDNWNFQISDFVNEEND